MPVPGCGGYTAATTSAPASVSITLPLLVTLVMTCVPAVKVFARSFILGNGTSNLVWLSGITVI